MTTFVPEAVIFDLDGLLLDTEPLYQTAYSEVISRFGKDYDQELRSNVLGRGEEEGAQMIVTAKQLPITAEELLNQRDELLEVLFLDCKPMPGAVELTKHLNKLGIPLAVATSSKEYFVGIKLRKHKDWFTIFDHLICGDNEQVKNSKPAPDIFIAAAKAINKDPTKCLVFEDSPSGAEAGYRAGAHVIAVQQDAQLRETRYPNANLVLSSLEELNLSTFGLQEIQ